MAKKLFTLDDKLEHKKVAIYIRVSTHWQVDKDSLQVQRRELITYAEMVLNITDNVVFEDPGYSAKNTDRPAYQQMMDRLRTGEFTHLLVWKIDRISRNLLDFAQMYTELKKLGITFVSKNEQFDTSSAIGEAMLKIILVFAELERNMTSERVSAVMLSRASNGQWNGGRVCYGYKWDKENKEFSIIPQEASVIRKIFDLYEEKQSVLFVSRYLNDEGYLTRTEKSWSAVVIHEILKNPFYIGTYRYNLREEGDRQKPKNEAEWIVFENHHEPIISEVQFDRVQFILQRNIRGGYKRGETHVRKNIHIFAGMMKCGNCGNNMSATLDRRRASGFRPSLYGCSTRRNNKSQCQNKFVTDLYVGPFVFTYIANIMRAKNSISESTSVTMLERKLLRGDVFSDVEHIGKDELQQLRSLLLQGKTGFEFRPNNVFNGSVVSSDSLIVVKERKAKAERAITRLKQLYLYSDEPLSEKEYLIERQKLMDEIKVCDEKLSSMKEERIELPEGSDDFMQKASYFIMVEKLLDERTLDYEKYISSVEPTMPRNFISGIIDQIEITNGKITTIRFKNGIIHTFAYKQETEA